MRINVAVPEAHVAAPVLDAALESVTRLNETLLQNDEVPTFEGALKRGIKWKPEPPGAEHFDHASTVLTRGWGDCDDLAPYHAASLRVTGEDPGAEAIVKRSGPKRWHAVVRRSDGTIDDPSRRAGMGQPHEYLGATIPLMHAPRRNGVSGAFEVRPQVATRLLPNRGWQARMDVPWHHDDADTKKPTPTDYAMATLHMDPVASTALTGAIDGAIELAEAAGYADPDHIEGLCALADAIEGIEEGMGTRELFDDLCEKYGHKHASRASAVVGSLFGGLKSIANRAMHAAMPIINTAAHLAPIPGAAQAFDLAQHLMQHGGAPGAAAATPDGSTICFPANYAHFQ